MGTRKWGTASDVYHQPQWARTRKLILARCGGKCERCGKGEQLAIHHIIALRDNGAPYDPANLVALCRADHNAAHRAGQDKWRQIPQSQLILITGPPGAPLLAKALELAKAGDIIIDALLCAQSIFEGVTDFALLSEADAAEAQAVRASLIHAIRQGKPPRRCRQILITSSNSSPDFLPHHAKITVDGGGLAALLNRCESGELPAVYRNLILRYYADLERNAADYARSQRKEIAS